MSSLYAEVGERGSFCMLFGGETFKAAKPRNRKGLEW